MPKGVLLVLTRPTDASSADDYNRWYDEVHLADVLKLAGYTAARRYAVVPAPVQEPEANPIAHWNYLALYEVEADDLGKAHEELLAAAERGDLPLHDALEMDPAPAVQMFREITDFSSPAAAGR
jgi:hypothetical protein